MAGPTPASSVQELIRAAQPQYMLGGEGLATSDIGEVGQNPYGMQSGKSDSLPQAAPPPQQPPMLPPDMAPPQQAAVSEQFMDALREPSSDPQPLQPPPTSALGGTRPAAPEAAPPAAPALPAAPRLPDNRMALRVAGNTLMRSPSPAQRVQGYQMIMESYKPTEEETHQVIRARTLREQDEDLVRKQQETTRQRTRDQEYLNEGLQQFGANERQSREAMLATRMGVKPEDTFKRLVEPLPQTEGQKAVDKEYAKDYAAFKTSGQAVSETSVRQLRDVQKMLADPKTDLTGPFIGSLPDWANALYPTGQKAVAARELVEDVVQLGAKNVLDTQYAARELENLLARAYNPRLPEAENRVRLGRIVDRMQQSYRDKMALARHYEQFGTTAGYEGRKPATVHDLEVAMEGERGTELRKTDPSAPKQVQVVTPRPAQLSDTQALQDARDALAQGVPEALVQQRLEAWGVRF